MRRRDLHPEPASMGPAELEAFSSAAAMLIQMAEDYGCSSLTAHAATGVWRVTVTKVTGQARQRSGNYQRSSLPMP